MVLAQLGCRSVARLRPYRVQRAERRSKSGEMSGPQRITSGAIAIAARCPQRSPSQQTQNQREDSCSSVIDWMRSMASRERRFPEPGKPLDIAAARPGATIPHMTWWEDLILAVA